MMISSKILTSTKLKKWKVVIIF